MNKISKIIIALLILSNAIAIGFLFLGKKNHMPAMNPMKVIIEKLDFDKNQQQEFSELVDAHRKEIQAIYETITQSKNELYQGLKSENPAMNDSLLIKVTDAVKQIEISHFNHFVDIKSLCKDTQKQEFNKMADELTTIFQPKKPKGHDRNER